MKAKCLIALRLLWNFYLTRDILLRATNQFIVVATPSSDHPRRAAHRPDVWSWCLAYTKEHEHQTLLEQINIFRNAYIEAIRRETAGYQMSPRILSYMEKILEKMKPLQIEQQLQLQQLQQEQEFLLHQEYSSSEMKTRKKRKIKKKLRQTEEKVAEISRIMKIHLAQISRIEHLTKDVRGSESINKQT